MKRFFGLFKKPDHVVVVSGLPRSGTSMMMKMLEVGGLSPLIDGEREADEDNPKGYYEFERVKQLPKGDYGWLEDARGRVVKVISGLLVHLPPTHDYRVVFMRRAMPEILASQRKMLVRRGENPEQVSDEKLTALFQKHLTEAEEWMERRKRHIAVLYVSFNDLLQDAEPQVERVVEFLGGKLDQKEMLRIIDPELYRQRA